MAKKEIPFIRSRGVVGEMQKAILKTFKDFDTPMKMVEAKEGHRLFYFHLEAVKPVRMRAIKSFEDDLKYALGSKEVSIEAPVPGKKLVGITVPKAETPPALLWSDAIKDEEFLASGDLVVPLGQDEFGKPCYFDIAKAPHVLIGGTTGSGKSTLLHSLINSLVYKHTPERLRLILIDPKRVEFSAYNDLPHLMTSAITDAKKSAMALKWATKEMERRYDILHDTNVMNIASYHKTIYDRSTKTGDGPEALPYIVILFDEVSDCMAAYPKENEEVIVKLAQMGRGVGIHLILSTQRPSVKVITGSVKANISGRFALRVASQIDSRTIIDKPGAEKLYGQGDMLVSTEDESHNVRMQGYWIGETEINENNKNRIHELTQLHKSLDSLDLSGVSESDKFFAPATDDGEEDDLYEDAKQAVIDAGKASTSYLQRKLRIGYSRACRLMDMLEERGVIGSQDGSAPRVVVGANDEDGTFKFEMLSIEEEEEYQQAKEAVIAAGKASTSYIQRKLRIGYSKAARLIDLLEERGVVGPQDGSKPREVLKD